MKLKHLLLFGALALPASMAAQPLVNHTTAQGYLERGVLMYESHNYVGAIDQLSHLLKNCSDDDMIEQAEYYIALSRLERGEEGCVQALTSFIDNYPSSMHVTEAQMKLGDYYFYSTAYAGALMAYNNVPEGALNADANEDLLYRKAYCYLMLGDTDYAQRFYSELSGTKRYGDASTFYKAYIDYANGNYDSAYDRFSNIGTSGEIGYQTQYYLCQIDFKRKQFGKVISLGRALLKDGKNTYFAPELNRLVGESYYQTGDDAQAKAYLTQYVATTDSVIPTSAYALGVINYRNADYAEAARLLTQATGTADAMAQSAYMYLGQSNLKLGNLDAATGAFEKAAGMDYDQDVKEHAFYNYAVSKNKGGQTPFDKSIDMFEKFLNDYPKSEYAPKVEDYLADAYLSTTDYQRALTSISHIAKPSAKVLKAKQVVLYRLGTQSLSNGKTADAERYLAQALDIKNGDNAITAESRLWLSEAQYREGRYSDAAKNLSSYLGTIKENDPNYGIAQYWYGHCLYELEQYDKAKKAFTAATNSGTLDKNLLADAHRMLAETRYNTQDFEGADRSYDEAIALGEGAADELMLSKARIKGDRGQYAEQVKQIDEMLKKYPNSALVPQALLDKGDALAELDKSSDAIAAYNTVIKQHASTAQARKALLQKALLEKSAVSEDAAIKTYKQLISTYPSSAEAQTAAEDLKLIYADRGELQQFAKYLQGFSNGPKLDVDEIETLTFDAAEKAAVAAKPDISKMQAYLKQYPKGSKAAMAKYYIGRNYNSQGNYDEALKWLDNAINDASDADFVEDALAIKCGIFSRQGKHKEAYEAYSQLAKRASNADVRLVAQLGMMRSAQSLGNWKQTAACADAVLAVSGLTADEENDAILARAMSNAKLGNTAAAERDFKQLLRNPLTEQGSQAGYELAQMQFDAGNISAAETTAKALVSSGTSHVYWIAKGFIVLSDIYYKQGRTVDATESLESLKANYPGKEKDIFDDIETRLAKWKKSSTKSSGKNVNGSADNAKKNKR